MPGKIHRTQNLLGLYQLRFRWEHTGTSSGARSFTQSDVMLWIKWHSGSLWHLLRCYSAYDVSRAESIVAHQHRLMSSGCHVQHGSYHSWVPLSKDTEVGLTSGICIPVSHSRPRCSLRWAVLPSAPGWSLCTSATIRITVSLPLSVLDTFFSSDLSSLDNSIPLSSYFKSKFQLVGVLGEGWASVAADESSFFAKGTKVLQWF